MQGKCNNCGQKLDEYEKDADLCLPCFYILSHVKKRGYWKEGKITYMIEENEYPHDERCEGTMCWCNTRAKREKGENNERNTT